MLGVGCGCICLELLERAWVIAPAAAVSHPESKVVAFALGWLAPGMGWMWFLTAPGYPVAVAIFALIVMEAIHLLRHRRQLSALIHRMPIWARWTAYCALGFAILLWGESGSAQFIYVRF